MKENNEIKNLPGQKKTITGDNELPGYPSYPPGEDIFNKYREEKDIDPEDTSERKAKNENSEIINDIDLTGDLSASDLDIPGSELDDAMEEIGSEDEENNYYSLGSDNHNDLDENRG